jgi:hypothetical protein
LVTPSADAQTTTRRATNLASLLAYPGFYHGRPILIVGKVTLDPTGLLKVTDDDASIHRVWRNAPDDPDEVRVWTRLDEARDGIRLSTHDLRATFGRTRRCMRPGSHGRYRERRRVDYAAAGRAHLVPSSPPARAISIEGDDHRPVFRAQFCGSADPPESHDFVL